MRIADNLKRLRGAAGLSQAGLAKKAGVAQQLISQIESGKNTSTKYLPQIARALGASVEMIDPQFRMANDDERQQQIAEILEIHHKLTDHPEWQEYLLEQARLVESRVLGKGLPLKPVKADD